MSRKTYLSSFNVNVRTLGWFQKQLNRTRSMLEHVNRGQMKEFCSLISNLFLFFSWHFRVIPHFRSKFSKTKGGTLWWKKSEKNRFLCLIPQKNRLKKCRMVVKKILIFVEVMHQNVPKNRHFKQILLILAIFRYLFNHNFPKNQYFQKPISLPIYIFQSGSFEVSNIKIYFFQIFFIKGSPLWFLGT